MSAMQLNTACSAVPMARTMVMQMLAMPEKMALTAFTMADTMELRQDATAELKEWRSIRQNLDRSTTLAFREAHLP
ncbi:hypothetical protein OC846_000866 [Tilletia horrida]|uniref:Uncharacterized protein n=1 Tax=Tilletia horrida TaxID=155126 RepID=A0AAN6GTP6_9BASI|nr:hypothetical protein OC846_000866 [Tilletia horrida]